MEILELLNRIISILFFVCYSYQFVYIPIGLFFKRKKEKITSQYHNYAVLICARNEASVIGDLLDSINNQTYPKCLLHPFVLADNCTDETASIACNHGAIVYSRFNKNKVGKGYALHDLLEHIKQDFKNGFDGYFIFDADNVLSPNYIEEMNKVFSNGFDIVTGYRNSKNYGDNWISAGYSLWFLRESRYLNYVRSVIGSSCCVGGTGFMFSKRILEKMNGWNYHLLTEDIEFSVAQIIEKEKIGFCKEAILYDEQPTSFSQSIHQRMRWTKGYLQVLKSYGIDLSKGILMMDFSCFDMMMSIMPAFVLSLMALVCNGSIALIEILNGQYLIIALLPFLQFVLQMYLVLFVIGFITTISEWKQIKTSSLKKLLYCFSFPIFMFTYLPISFIAIFARVSWKPIVHTVKAESLKVQQ